MRPDHRSVSGPALARRSGLGRVQRTGCLRVRRLRIRWATARVERSGGRMLLRDTRRAFLSIQGPNVAISVRINNYVNVAAAVRRFAEQVNELAQQLGPAPTPTGAAVPIPTQIAQLAQLRDTGVLTNEEFEKKKRQLLDEM